MLAMLGLSTITLGSLQVQLQASQRWAMGLSVPTVCWVVQGCLAVVAGIRPVMGCIIFGNHMVVSFRRL